MRRFLKEILKIKTNKVSSGDRILPITKIYHSIQGNNFKVYQITLEILYQLT